MTVEDIINQLERLEGIKIYKNDSFKLVNKNTYHSLYFVDNNTSYDINNQLKLFEEKEGELVPKKNYST